MNGVALDKAPGFQVSKHAKVLSNRRHIDFLLEVDNIVAEVALLVEGLGDERLALSSGAS